MDTLKLIQPGDMDEYVDDDGYYYYYHYYSLFFFFFWLIIVYDMKKFANNLYSYNWVIDY